VDNHVGHPATPGQCREAAVRRHPARGAETWARVTGIVIAVISALVNMAFLAAHPIWATIVIAVDVLVIYALAVHGREVKSRY
jgi:hypothetical protein